MEDSITLPSSSSFLKLYFPKMRAMSSTLSILGEVKQWAAVTINRSEISEPPHMNEMANPMCRYIATSHGQVPRWIVWPWATRGVDWTTGSIVPHSTVVSVSEFKRFSGAFCEELSEYEDVSVKFRIEESWDLNNRMVFQLESISREKAKKKRQLLFEFCMIRISSYLLVTLEQIVLSLNTINRTSGNGVWIGKYTLNANILPCCVISRLPCLSKLHRISFDFINN